MRDRLKEQEDMAYTHCKETHCGKVLYALSDLVPVLQARRARKLDQWDRAVGHDLYRRVGAPIVRWQVWAEQRATAKGMAEEHRLRRVEICFKELQSHAKAELGSRDISAVVRKHWRSSALRRAFRGWSDNTEETRRLRRLISQLIARMKHQQLCICCDRWADYARFVLKMMNFALKMMNCALKMMRLVLKRMIFAFKSHEVLLKRTEIMLRQMNNGLYLSLHFRAWQTQVDL